MSLPSGNAAINIRNLGYFQSLGAGAKFDPQKFAEALDDIQTAFSQLNARIVTLESAQVPTPTSTVKTAPTPFSLGVAG